MQEVFEKIIEKLEEYRDENLVEHDSEMANHCKQDCNDVNDCTLCVWDKAIEIVKQEAEKYNNGWIPVRYHYITDEEREEGCISEDIAYWFDCKIPDDGEEILITRKWRDGYIVEHDMCMVNDGYCLDSGLDWIDVIAWHPLPEPYQPKGE